MSLTYSLIVNGGVYGEQSAHIALKFAHAVIEKGHRLERVFFYQDGVYNANALTLPANDEINLSLGWLALSQKHNVQLETCIAAALRRGVVSSVEQEQHQLNSENLRQGYQQAGLGSLAQALIMSDRVVQF